MTQACYFLRQEQVFAGEREMHRIIAILLAALATIAAPLRA